MAGMKLCFGLAAAAALLAGPQATFAQSAAPVTFSKDVAPIFQAKCQSCHEPGSIAPMSLATFKDARSSWTSGPPGVAHAGWLPRRSRRPRTVFRAAPWC